MSREHFLLPVLGPGAWGLRVARTGVRLVTHLEIAGGSAARRTGLLGRDGLPAGHALIIAPCQAVHTFGMRFPIDVVGVDRAGRVVTVKVNVPRSRIAVSFRAFAIVELPAGSCAVAGLRIGDRLVPQAMEETE